MEKINKEKLIKIKNVIIFILLFFWRIMPILQSITVINEVIESTNLYFILMKIIAIVGIGSAIFVLYDKFENANSKKEVFKEVLPIFIFILYMAWTLISCHLALNKNMAFNGEPYRKEGYYMYINYAGFFFCAFLLEDKKLRKILLNTFVIVSIFLIAISRITFGGEIFTNNEIEDSVFHQFNHYGYYLMMSLICCLGLFMTQKNKILKVIYLVTYTIIGYATIYNNTFGCYLAVTAILILYGIYSLIKNADRKSILIAIVIFAILSGITFKNNKNLAYNNLSSFAFDVKSIVIKLMNLNVDDEEINKNFEKAGTSRIELWVNGIKFALEKPIIGYGPDNLWVKYRNVSILVQDRPHNLLIYLACVSGFPGMLIYVAAVGIIVTKGIKKLFNNNENGKIFLIIVVTYLISSMFGNSMYYTSPYFFIFLGSLMNCNLTKKEE